MAYYILTDCVNLSHEIPNKSIARKFDIQKLLDVELSKAPHHNKTSCRLPLYVIGMEMKYNQLYKTNRSVNVDCCCYYVIKTDKFVQNSTIDKNSVIIDVDLDMVKQMFGNTVLDID